MEKELLYKNRSFSSCINAAFKLQIENLKNILKCTWLPILIQSIIAGCYTSLFANSIMMDGWTKHPFVTLSVMLLVAVLQLVATAWTLSRLMSLLNEQPRRWNFRRSLWMLFSNTVISVAFVSIFSGAAGAAIGFVLAKAQAEEASPGMPMSVIIIIGVYLLLLLLYFCLVQLPLMYTSMRYLNVEKMKFWRDLLPCHRTGLRHWGFIFITLLLSSIIISVICLLLMTPAYILGFARFTSEMGVVTGDPSGLPSYFPWLQFITTVVVLFFVYQVFIFEVLVIYFMYGSIETQEEERNTARITPPIPTATEVQGFTSSSPNLRQI